MAPEHQTHLSPDGDGPGLGGVGTLGICKDRNGIERFWGRLEEWRALSTRHEKTARSLMGVLRLAASMDWLKR